MRAVSSQNPLNWSQVFSKSIFDTKTTEVTINKNMTTNAILLFEINLRSVSDRTAVFVINRKRNGFPFPLLPEDTTIRVMDTLTDCNSVTTCMEFKP